MNLALGAWGRGYPSDTYTSDFPPGDRSPVGLSNPSGPSWEKGKYGYREVLVPGVSAYLNWTIDMGTMPC